VRPRLIDCSPLIARRAAAWLDCSRSGHKHIGSRNPHLTCAEKSFDVNSRRSEGM